MMVFIDYSRSGARGKWIVGKVVYNFLAEFAEKVKTLGIASKISIYVY